MIETSRRRLALGAVASLLGLCIGALPSCVDPAFACQRDEQCGLDGGEGRCESTGFCSYPDDGCSSGRRYSDLAGSYAAQCVGEPIASGTDSAGTTTGRGSSTTAGTTSNEMSSTGEQTGETGTPVCGDGVVQPPEVCDDPDGELGRGCDRSCEEAGTIVFLELHDGGVGNDMLLSVASLSGGEAVVAGIETVEGTGRDILVQRYDAEGSVVWSDRYDAAGGTDDGRAVETSGDGSVFVGGLQRAADRSIDAFRGAWGPGGQIDYGTAIPNQVTESVAHTVQANLVLVGSNFGGMGWAALYPTWNATALWGHALTAEGESALVDVTARSESEMYATGHVDHQLVLVRVADTGIDVIAEIDAAVDPPADRGQAIARAPQADWLAVAGFVTDVAGRHAWLGKFELDGTLRWSLQVTSPSGEAEFEAVVVDELGTIYVGGFEGGDGKQAWLRAYDSEGDFLWARWLDTLAGGSIVRDLALASDGDLWAVGETEGPRGDLDGFIARLRP